MGWLDYPASMRHADIAVVAVFTALVVGSDFALTPFVNFKLLDTVVFLVAFVYGFRPGAAVAILSETVWSVVSPWGPAGIITPFLVAGELMFAVAGSGASRLWGSETKTFSPTAVFIGATLAVCAFLWDFETNAASALVWYGTSLTLPELSLTELAGFLFPVPMAHELGDFILGTLLVPATLLVMPRVRRRS